MNFNTLKLLFYTLVVHVINPDIPNKVTAFFECRSNRSKLNKIVNDFKMNYDLKKGAEYITQDQGNEFGNVSTEFINFEIDLLLILQQMAHLLKRRNETGFIHKEYFLTVCSLFPRCLDYININVFQNLITVMLNKIHIVLCHTLPTYFIKNINASRDDAEKELIYKETDRNLTYIISMLQNQTKKNDTLLERPNYEKDSKNFLFKVYNILGKIDLISCISKNLNKLNNYYKVNNIYYGKKLKIPDTRGNKNEHLLERNTTLEKVNINYSDKLKKNCGLSKYEIRTYDLSKIDAMDELLVYTLNKLQQFFTNTILSNKGKHSETTVENLSDAIHITKTLLDLCKNISYILVFFKENRIKDDSTLFNLYFTFCFDFMEYTDIRCNSAFHNIPAANNFKTEWKNCKWESLKNLWTYNIFITTTQVPIIKNDKDLKNKDCIHYYINYLVTLYDVIKMFDKQIGVWTTFQWLSGKYFLTENFENVDMNELKLKNINIKNVNMSLSVAYYALLPWSINTFPVGLLHNMILQHLNRTMNTYVYRYALIIDLYLKRTSSSVNSHVLQSIRDSVRWYTGGTEIFYKYLNLPLYTDKDPQNESLPPVDHNMILQHLNRTMNTYVYRYALIIDLYLKRTSSSVNFHVLQNIRDSVRWYTDGTALFYKYLDLPLFTDKDPQNESSPSFEIKSIILRIKYMDDIGKISLNDIIPKDVQDDFLKWSDTELPDNDDGYQQFNTVINKNCMDAMDYMSTFLSIAVKSLDIKSEFYPPPITYTEYCPENIFNVKSVENPIRVFKLSTYFIF
ncbi:Hypothetical protein CINCED_3A004243 [Cinara cedri]|uniref:Integrase catalytic domain-containing protein n=1 Tax=Cinara cedri TaxID=506608 RepID=A0A5E4M344_9HEMI|nr:Hypothetical protein CINCED_3A004243 [Cinara cedri]